MEKIMDEISREVLIQELLAVGKVRNTRKGENEIYLLNNKNAPNTVQEIGRLREVTFRASGGGTGLTVDLDEYDTGDFAYEQLIVWSPEDQEIVGGYRFAFCSKALDELGKIHLSTAHYFDFSSQFVNEYLPFTIELGRSWVQPNFQPTVNPRKGLFALDNIWDGLGVLVKEHPEIRYFFGKVTMYPNYDTQSRDYLLHFMHRFFPDREQLMAPKHPLQQNFDPTFIDEQLKGLDFKDAFRVLNGLIRDKGEFIPPLVNIYMNLSPTMKTFGTAVNPEFGGVEETGILVTIDDIFIEKKERHMAY
ncbi:MAG: GNAT family N-acetyltransferase [Flavobacteriia bacterium]|nr:GNAT family N-acetyltransferase [Flavobacteriia bacterium]